MRVLAAQQQALLDALFASPAHDAVQRLNAYAYGVGTHPQRGLKVYRANGHMLAECALRAAYPVMAQLLGSESFADLARAFWHANPPLRGDVTQWGIELPDFVHASTQLQDEPYLADVARAEWALHCCALAADQASDLSTLAMLTHRNPQTLSLKLGPGLALFASAWPLASIMLAHLEGIPSLAEVGLLLRKQTPQDVVIWRDGLQPRLRLALPGELRLLHAMLSGVALETALDAAIALDFSQWLPLAVESGLVLGAYAISTDVPTT